MEVGRDCAAVDEEAMICAWDQRALGVMEMEPAREWPRACPVRDAERACAGAVSVDEAVGVEACEAI